MIIYFDFIYLFIYGFFLRKKKNSVLKLSWFLNNTFQLHKLLQNNALKYKNIYVIKNELLNYKMLNYKMVKLLKKYLNLLIYVNYNDILNYTHIILLSCF